jgi:hypothetical protein
MLSTLFLCRIILGFQQLDAAQLQWRLCAASTAQAHTQSITGLSASIRRPSSFFHYSAFIEAVCFQKK